MSVYISSMTAANSMGPTPDAVVQARVPGQLDRRTDLLGCVEHEPDHRAEARASAGRLCAV